MLSRTWLQCPLLLVLHLFLFYHCMCLHISPVEDGVDFFYLQTRRLKASPPPYTAPAPPQPRCICRLPPLRRHLSPQGFAVLSGALLRGHFAAPAPLQPLQHRPPQPWSPRRMTWTPSSSPTCWTATRPRAGPGPPSVRAFVALLRGRELFCYPTRKRGPDSACPPPDQPLGAPRPAPQPVAWALFPAPRRRPKQ